MKAYIATCTAIALTFSLAGRTTSAATSDNYPSKPIRLIVGFTPAAATDFIARALAQKLAEQMGTPVIVDNRPGAGGNIAYDIGVKAPADGYTLIFNTGGLVQNYALSSKRSYHPLRDFAPVSMVSKSPLLLVANTTVPASNVTELVAYAKANPDKLSYGSAGAGNITHLGNLLFQKAVGIKAIHIPYKGTAPALTDLIGGQINYSTPTTGSALPFLKDKRLKPLAILGLKRMPVLPDVPTASETVAPTLEVGGWLGVLALAKTPPAIVKRLNMEIVKALNEADLRTSPVFDGAEVVGSSPEEYAAYIRVELERWTKIIKESDLKLD